MNTVKTQGVSRIFFSSEADPILMVFGEGSNDFARVELHLKGKEKSLPLFYIIRGRSLKIIYKTYLKDNEIKFLFV